MKLLFVSSLDSTTRSVYTIAKYLQAGEALGQEAAVFGEPSPELPSLPFSLDVGKFDFAVFVVHVTWDFPALPHLAWLLDGIPKERRVIIDCWGRYNETVRVEHDFNHLEKLDKHQGWEWIEAFQAVSDKILQPTLTPLRQDVRSLLFHGYDPAAVARPYDSPAEAAQAWSSAQDDGKPYGIVYAGNNWQRWTQLRPFLQAVARLRDNLGAACLVGWDWNERPDWAAQLGLHGADIEPDLLRSLGVETREAIRFDEIIEFLGQGRFSPVFQRPLFNHLGLVSNRMFETFCADTLPILMLPADLVEAIYGPTARLLVPDGDVAGCLEDMMRRPEAYWEAVLQTRAHLTQHHSYQQRFKELLAILQS